MCVKAPLMTKNKTAFIIVKTFFRSSELAKTRVKYLGLAMEINRGRDCASAKSGK